MKKIFVWAVFFLVSPAHADWLPIECANTYNFCQDLPNGGTQCNWLSINAFLFSIRLNKTSQAPDIEFWEGESYGLVQGKYPYKISVSQRREKGTVKTTLTATLTVDDLSVIGIGENNVEARLLRTTNNQGLGVQCKTSF